jgi:signal transduction histidine kinase
VGELLDFSRLEAGRPLDLDCRPVDLIALVREEVAAQQRTTTRHRLVLEVPVDELVGELDGPRVSRVIANLLSNAVKYSPNGGTITVNVAPDEGGWVTIGVRDEGLGIPAADLDHVFERFERGSNVAGRIAGSGLGLAGAKQIVEQHGGTISVESTEGSGATFSIRLPLVPVGEDEQ